MFESFFDFLMSLLMGSGFESISEIFQSIISTQGDVYPVLYFNFLLISFGCIIICLTLSFVFKFLLKLVD